MKIQDRSFFMRDTVQVAQELLGKYVVSRINGVSNVGMIVETEAYRCFDDPASHAYGKMTRRNRAMFGDVGCAYVYFIYGVHYCFNVVARNASMPAGAVLIRALEPIDNETLRTNGPGRLTALFGITREHNMMDLTTSLVLYLTHGITVLPEQIIATTRVGITKGKEKQWRFYIDRNQWVSKIRTI